MNETRYNELMSDLGSGLSPGEISQGWHFCREFDGLLVGPGMGELNCCFCLDPNHGVYKTAPKDSTLVEGDLQW